MKTNIEKEEKYNKAHKQLVAAKELMRNIWVNDVDLDTKEEKNLDEALSAIITAISRLEIAAMYNTLGK